jgi:hypothetical protein
MAGTGAGTGAGAGAEPEDDGEAQPRADCAVDVLGALAVELALPTAEKPRLELRLRPRKGQDDPGVPPVHVDLAPTGDGARWHAVLDPATYVLAEGRWDCYVRDSPGAPRRRLAAGIRDVRALLDRRPDPAATPVAVRIPYATKKGHLAVRAWLRRAHAEAGSLRVGEDAATVHAVLYGAALDPGAVAVARLRGDRATRYEMPVAARGEGEFGFTLDYSELVRRCGGSAAVWDLHVRPAPGAPTVRIGRLFDDVVERKQIFAYPAMVVGGASVHPYYTLDNDLSVEVTEAV